MSEEANNKKPRKKGPKRWMIAFVLLYVLSFQPAQWLRLFLWTRLPPAWAERTWNAMSFIYPIIYAPLVWAHDCIPGVAWMMNWYGEMLDKILPE